MYRLLYVFHRGVNRVGCELLQRVIYWCRQYPSRRFAPTKPVCRRVWYIIRTFYCTMTAWFILNVQSG